MSVLSSQLCQSANNVTLIGPEPVAGRGRSHAQLSQLHGQPVQTGGGGGAAGGQRQRPLHHRGRPREPRHGRGDLRHVQGGHQGGRAFTHPQTRFSRSFLRTRKVFSIISLTITKCWCHCIDKYIMSSYLLHSDDDDDDDVL